MLVVLDAGVFVSAVTTPGGVASRIVSAGIEGHFEFLVCPMLVGELTDVLGRPKIAHHAERIVTGDADLFAVDDPPVPVVRLRAFLDLFAAPE